LGAARAALETSMKVRELVDLDEQLVALEQRITADAA
jgi:hypothetical protein